ncbi:hypothetical protein [Kitasatospora sp. MAP5-34]|uniref:hypothetical protein n=1 Tax=Kitasatospora sp. MAP5-34 TaxID=3035102 RepID=UPI0024757E00|nr:hypothetical protein [Kitasatospora sp. MAP5-34]MDH6576315.1 hypothetical protein [Kitasatospora sp. MAP5-34]
MRLRAIAAQLAVTTALLGLAVPAAAAATGGPHAVLSVKSAGKPHLLSYLFDGSASTGPVPIVKQEITFGDSPSQYDCTHGCTHTYSSTDQYLVKLTVTDRNGNTDSAIVEVGASYPAGRLRPASGRILDTRTGYGHRGKLGPGGELTVNIDPVKPANGITNNNPSILAAVVNVTVVNPTADSYLTVYPTGQARPTTSNSNFTPGQTSAHLVTVPLGADGTFTIYNHTGSTDIVVDTVGWYTPVGEDNFTDLAPTRVLDTRIGLGTGKAGQIAPHTTSCFTLPADKLGLPSDVDSVVLNLTATRSDRAGFLATTRGSDPHSYTGTSNVNFGPGETVANQVIAPVLNGRFCVKNGPADVDAVADVSGYYDPHGYTAFTPVTPGRLLDTRTPEAPIGPGGWRRVVAANISGFPVPLNATTTVVNLTATGSDRSGYLTAFSGFGPDPDVSNVNFAAGQTVSNLAYAGLGHYFFNVYNSAGHTDAVVDLFGYFSRTH